MLADITLGAGRVQRGSAGRLREALLALAQHKASIANHSEKSWASITFAGTRHRVDLVFEGAEAIGAGELFIAFLPEHEFALPGQLVADAAVIAVDHALLPQPRLSVTAELLVLDEG